MSISFSKNTIAKVNEPREGLKSPFISFYKHVQNIFATFKLLLGAVALRACAVLALRAALGAGAAALVLAALVGGALALAARAAGADGAAGAGGAAFLLVAAGGSFEK